MKQQDKGKLPAIKAGILIFFVVAAIALARSPSVRDFLTAEKLGAFLDTAGPWAPLTFILAYTLGVCLFVPGTLLTALGAAIFGPYQGFLYVWTGAMAGASLAFFIGRTSAGISPPRS